MYVYSVYVYVVYMACVYTTSMVSMHVYILRGICVVYLCMYPHCILCILSCVYFTQLILISPIPHPTLSPLLTGAYFTCLTRVCRGMVQQLTSPKVKRVNIRCFQAYEIDILK